MPTYTDKQWYYAKARQRFGPVTAHALAQLYHQGDVQDADLVWAPHMEQWQRAGAVRDQFVNAPPPPPERERTASYSSPVDPLPQAAVDYSQGTGRVAVQERFEYGGFLARFAAIIIDGIILGIINMVVIFLAVRAFGSPASDSGQEALGTLVYGLIVVIQWLYFALQESGSYSATFGKRALGLTVTDLNGDMISFWRATARYFSKIISAAICLIGYFFVLFTPRKQALHDIIAGCVVLK